MPDGRDDLLIRDEDFAAYLRESEPRTKVLPASAFLEELRARLSGQRVATGAVLPWSKTHRDVQFRRGEVTLWSGINGHRKSMVTGQMALSLCAQGERVLIVSLEMRPAVTLERMARQAAGCAKPSESFVEALVSRWLTGRMWLYDHQGKVDARTLFAVLRYGADRLGVTHAVIDSLMKCVRGADDYNAQKDFVDDLTTHAKDCGLHIHLVHHIRKGESEDRVPGKFDVKGAGELTDQVDNVIVVWKNKVREQALRDELAGRPLKAAQQDAIDKAPDQLLIVEKQRNGEFEGPIALWFDSASLQLIAAKDRGAMQVVGDIE